MTVCSTIEEFRRAWKREYDRLADVYRALLVGRGGTVVEIGSGRGQLTFPLARAAEGCRFTCVDSYPSPYAGSKRIFESGVSRDRRLKDRVGLVIADGTEWLSRQRGRAFDVIMSNEFLGEIEAGAMRRFFEECHRVLKHGGLCAHSFLSPAAKNRRQRLLVEANVNPKWTRFPPKEWFSPPPDVVASQMRSAEFRNVRTANITIKLTVVGGAAKSVLRGWRVVPSFWTVHEKELMSEGLEFPDWTIVTGERE